MGKEWLYWAGGGGSSRRSAKRENSSGGGGGGGGGGGERESTTPGCMCAVLQLFDFHPFPYPLNHHSSFLPEDQTTTTLKGLEAPRNSLELEVPSIGAASSLSSTLKDEENLSIPMGIQIKTRRSRTDELSSEYSSSPSTKSPNLVARLMGLDLLPDHKPSTCSSTSSSSSSKHWSSNPPSKSQLHPRLVKSDIDITGTRSLPETPRISSARRSDVDPHHRLSLQINKENTGNNLSEEFEIIPCGTTRLRRRDLKLIDENRSPRHCAREIVKQVKEKVGRRVGIHDITNTVKNRGDRLISDDDDDHVVLLKSKKPYSKGGLLRMDDEMSPRLKSAIKNLNSESPKYSQSTKLVSPIKSKSQSFQEQGEQVKQKISSSKCKKGVGERFNPRLKKPMMQTSDAIRTKQEEQFVRSSTINRVNHSDKKSKKTPLLDIPIKKDPSPPATTLPQKQESDSATSKQNTQLSSCLSHSYHHQETTHKPTAQESNNNNNKDDDRFNGSTTTTTTADKGAEYQYITRILKGTNIDKNTRMSFTNLYSLLPHHHHPLDPSIFHFLELSLQTNTIIVATSSPHDLLLSQRCNRKLIFQLVDEILGEILKTHINFNPWFGFINSSINCGSELLVDTVYEKIQSYPLADCRVLEDIDSLIDQDLGKFTKNQRFIELEEEGESIVLEIENQIVDSLVGETAMVVFGVFGYGRTVTESDGGHMGRSRDEMLFVGSWDPLFKDWDS